MVDHDIKQHSQVLKKNAQLVSSVFILLLVSFIGAGQIVNYFKSDYDYLINISGRQRMLSQKLAYLKTNQLDSKNFKLSLSLFQSSQKEILELASNEQREFYTKNINRPFIDYTLLLQQKNVSAQELLMRSEQLLHLLDKAVKRFELESNKFEKIHFATAMVFLVFGLVIIYWLQMKVLAPQRKAIVDTLNLYSQAKDEAYQQSLAKSVFLANMTHELRTPLNGIIGLGNFLRDSNLDEEQTHYLENMQKASHSLLEIINDVLDFTKVDAGHLQFYPRDFKLELLMNELKSLLKPKADEKKLTLKFLITEDVPEYVHLDPLRFKQILMNLINNAIKFTRQGEVELKISVEGEFLISEVSDSGIGISAENLAHIFDEFEQIENTYVKSQEGTGLGLALVKKLTEISKGEIEVESTLNQGSLFRVKLPLVKGNAPAFVCIEDDEVEYIGFIEKILLVEDNKMNQLVAGTLLKKIELAYDIANNGLEAIDMCRSNSYDLILTDISMPQMNGFEATEIIRKFNPEIPIICLSANVFEGDQKKALQVGMNDFLEKPIKKSQLIRILNRFGKPLKKAS